MSHEHCIAIYGPGLLGGSLAMAIRQLMPQVRLQVWARRDEAAKAVQARGLADLATTDPLAAAQGASLIILATPIEHMPGLAEAIKPVLAADAIVTDVGSVKGSVVAALSAVLGPAFLGSHPMAGSERTGLDAGRADLFQNAACIVTPTLATPAQALERVQAFWKALGCRLLSMSPEEHDRKIARISHLPHSVAAALTLAALRADPSAVQCSAGGFRDSTRIAGGDPDLWTGILLENRDQVLPALQDAVTCTQELLAILQRADKESLRRYLSEAQQLRSLVAGGASHHGND